MSYEYETDSYAPSQKEYDMLCDKFHDTQIKLMEARKIIADFVCSQISYMSVNDLGDPFKQQDVKRAVKFLLEEK